MGRIIQPILTSLQVHSVDGEHQLANQSWKTNWDFNVQKVCLLACPDCYNPSQHKSICINGEWQKGYGGDTHGRCVMEERCPDRPWWPIGNGQWSCNSFNNKIRSCGL